jgi:hypothetical protein
MSRILLQQALDALEFPHDSEWSNKAKAIKALQHALTQPEQAIVPFPSFMRKRIEEAIDNAINPKGMSVHDGKATVYASDLQRMIAVIDLAPTLKAELAKPWQEPKLSDAGADTNIDPFTLYPKGSGWVTLNQVGMRVDLKDATPRKPWVGLTDDEKTEIFMQAEFNDLTERQMYDVVEAKLKEKNNAHT